VGKPGKEKITFFQSADTRGTASKKPFAWVERCDSAKKTGALVHGGGTKLQWEGVTKTEKKKRPKKTKGKELVSGTVSRGGGEQGRNGRGI